MYETTANYHLMGCEDVDLNKIFDQQSSIDIAIKVATSVVQWWFYNRLRKLAKHGVLKSLGCTKNHQLTRKTNCMEVMFEKAKIMLAEIKHHAMTHLSSGLVHELVLMEENLKMT